MTQERLPAVSRCFASQIPRCVQRGLPARLASDSAAHGPSEMAVVDSKSLLRQLYSMPDSGWPHFYASRPQRLQAAGRPETLASSPSPLPAGTRPCAAHRLRPPWTVGDTPVGRYRPIRALATLPVALMPTAATPGVMKVILGSTIGSTEASTLCSLGC